MTKPESDFVHLLRIPNLAGRCCCYIVNVHNQPSRPKCMVYGEYADRHRIEPISENFRPKPKKIHILDPHSIHDRIDQKPSHATVPLTTPYSRDTIGLWVTVGVRCLPSVTKTHKSTDSLSLPNTLPTLPTSSANCAQPHTISLVSSSHCPLYLSL